MNDDKTKRLQLTLWEIQKRWGEQSIGLLSTLRDVDRSSVIESGFQAFNDLFESGIPRGTITELRGTPTSGMTTLTLSIMVSAQAQQQVVAYLDLNNTFDPVYALHCGVALERLLIVRPASLMQGLEIARDLFKAGKLSAVVLDLLTAGRQAKPRDFDTLLRRLHEPLTKSGSAALLLLPAFPRSHWQSLDPYTALRLSIERQDWLYQGQEVSGYRVRITVLKDKGHPGSRQAFVDIIVDESAKAGGA